MTYKEVVSNRRAFRDYDISESFEAGVVLQGTEVKSLRDHGGGLTEAYVRIIRSEAWLIGSSIALYRFGNFNNHEEKRDRKLLLHKRELNKLKKFAEMKGYTLVPLALVLKNGLFKLKIGCGKGRREFDKRQAVAEKEGKRAAARAIKRSTES
ncbi:SsrA-binding protein SmpB [Candidatus Clavichlamydia salmonicola]|uniref:SsrA-binding protein SmpB n=1 Tax=Candidatus Clavichlamydia salmonicola TaxID=469812 RepID=UPI001891BBEE|nr:SsrA-binding protein SmpB [Candidatus Clavichlamydia salmonicola]